MLKKKLLLIGLFLAFPPMNVWARQSPEGEPLLPPEPVPSHETSLLQVPVEVISKDGKTQWVMVEVSPEAIPEPEISMLVITLSGLLFLRRRRKE